MPVSVERLIAEIEPNVITEQLTRDCIQVGACLLFACALSLLSACAKYDTACHSHPLPQIPGSDPETLDEKRRSILFKDVECLAFSFKSIAKIDSLKACNSSLMGRQLEHIIWVPS